ncbi:MULTISPECIES: xanthine dehydrogenase small subunit [unclassified Acidovorax]|uniref:xanthine dehydrogenase small subunit n=1 Tax=unclassified Acidovorax TaxID=2684926 RepID=UPI002883238D|nr:MULTISPECIES: xanthine dehydrogenase small subunit [unclassified Acidovorax]
MTISNRPLRFFRRGQPQVLHGVPPDRTLLEVLREDLGATGTKEGCGEGDCGACTVVLGEARGGRVHYHAINSCIRLAHSIDGMALWTVEDLAADPLIQPTASPGGATAIGDASLEPGPAAQQPDGTLHPAQEAMVQCHGSQCGFCTPGFVMSLFGMYQNHVCQGRTITRTLAAEELSGNLCRCTGYRPILDAAQQMHTLPPVQVDEPLLLQELELLALDGQALEADLAYISPTTLDALLAARAAHPGAQVVAGATDVGLWVTKQHRRFAQVLDVTRAAPLRRIDGPDGWLRIGAAVSLADAFAALCEPWPQLHSFAARFAGLPVRNSGTLGGNVANGSPIGDSMPLLIALGAQVVLASVRGERALPLEDLYTGYRQNVMAADELLVRIDVPLPAPGERLAAYKVSKRFDDDISAVCLVVNLRIEGATVQAARIGAGGVAATPARARQTEAALAGQPWNTATVRQAAAALQAEFNPISDMRASGDYRREVLGALMQRYWLESQGDGTQAVSLQQLQATQPSEVTA